jgi:peptide/nickel transport system substrate-binding protein
MSRQCKRITRIGLGIIIIWILVAGAANAAELTIGLRAEPSMDPHFLYLTTNLAYSAHVYAKLVRVDENSKRIPDLATSWKALNDTTWEFKLRQGVKFHDGSAFTAEDVVFSINRVPKVPNNPTPYTAYTSRIIEMEIVDPYTIRFKLDKITASLPADLVKVVVVSKKAAEGATTADFASGKAAVGTGPFRFVKYVPGDRVELVRNENYWGEKPAWDKVTMRMISNDAARVATLLGGDVDMIEYVPPSEVDHLEKNKNFRVFKRPTLRLMYVSGVHRMIDTSPYLTTKDGKPLPQNPFKDIRVRRAISMAINREVICKEVYDGLAAPASQLVPEKTFGYNPDLKVEKYDPARAKKLLAEAGYPDGFGVTIHGPNDRYPNDAKTCQAVGQMLARIGLTVKIETMPGSIYFSKIRSPNKEFPFYLLAWGNTSGESLEGMTQVLHSYDKDKGYGNSNRSNYANPDFDLIAEKAVATNDDAEREKLLRGAMAIAINDLAIIPLHALYTVAATRKGLNYVPRADEETWAMNVKPAP